MRLWRRKATDEQLDAELQEHLRQLIQENLAAGMAPEEARRQAQLAFGHVESTKEALRDLQPAEWLQSIAADVRYALRKLRVSPVFTAVAIFSLALGIGANTTIFSLVNATLMRLLPVERPEELHWFATSNFGRILNYPFYQHIASDPRFDGVLCTFPTFVNAGRAGAMHRVEMELVSENYFQALGVRPHKGRLLMPGDEAVAVLSHGYWQGQLGADPRVVGQAITINNRSFTVVGIAQPGFQGIDQGWQRALFVPMQMKPQITPGWNGLDKPLIAWVQLAGRLKPGADAESLGRELTERLHAFQKPFVDADPRLTQSQRQMIRTRSIRLEQLRDGVLDTRVRLHLKTLVWIVGALLLLACVNLGGLLLARGVERQREIATRLAIGGSQLRVVRQLFLESLLLGTAGGTAGFLLAAVIAPWLAARFPLAGPGSQFDATPDVRVLAYTMIIALGCCVFFGLAPAWQSTRVDLISSIRGAAHAPAARRMGRMLLGAQVAVALVLLAAAGLFSRNLHQLLHHDLGFRSENLLLAELEPVLNGYDESRRLRLYQAIEARLAEEAGNPQSGIAQGALANVAPVSGYYWTSGFVIEGREREKDLIPRGMAVSTNYFQFMGMQLRQGRLFDARDRAGAPRAAVISESLARKAFPEGTAVGRRFMADPREPEKTRFEIVGVVADANLYDPRNRNLGEAVYVPYMQWAFSPQAMVIQARATRPEAIGRAAETLRRAVRELDPNLALYDIRTTEAALDNMLRTERMVALLSSAFAVLAALLAAIGLHGLLAREVAARTREAAIRLALGASRGAVLWALTGRTLRAVALGIGCGVVMNVALQPVLRPLLVDGSPVDGVALATAVVLLVIAAVLGAWWPARRATRVDPATALRGD